jgi:glycosyltransferase involved in cell wall biosynthesis
MRLALVISSMQSGGAERVLSLLANGFVAEGDDVSLITIAAAANSDFYKLDSRVKRLSIGTEKRSTSTLTGLFSNVARIARLRQSLAALRPDCVLSFSDRTNVLAILAARSLGLRVIVSERSDFSACDIGGRLWELLRNISYPRAQVVVFQTSEVAERFCRERVPVTFEVIGNPIATEFTVPVNQELKNFDGPSIVAMGRLSHEKGFDILLEAFGRVADGMPDWKLTIFGEGPCREALEAQRRASGLDSRVHLPGRTTSPARDLAMADLFVLSSRFEGMPNAMLEAMALGIPVIAVDCSAGVRELSKAGRRSLLVPPGDAVSLSEALRQITKDPLQRAALGRAGREVLAEYDASTIIARWRSLCAGLNFRASASSST